MDQNADAVLRCPDCNAYLGRFADNEATRKAVLGRHDCPARRERALMERRVAMREAFAASGVPGEYVDLFATAFYAGWDARGSQA